LRRWTYHTFFGLLAVTGLRLSEAQNLRIKDITRVQIVVLSVEKKEVKALLS